MRFSGYQTVFLVVPGLVSLALLFLAAASGSIRTATLPLLCAAFFGMFAMTVVPQTAHLLVSYPSYRNFRNLLCFCIGGLSALLTVGLLLLGVVAIGVVQLDHGAGA